ncbi:MAG: hypothetical protein GWP61_27540 [Chloroflexi bacterium]|jgi:hypothetical protein|nr:hypothetical protein [Chloroflexota bacterium]
MNQFDRESMKTHVTILGWLNIADGALTLLIGALAFIFLTGIGFASGDLEALPILAAVGTTAGLFMFALAIPSLLAGIGLLWEKNWGRILAIVVSFFNLLWFPVGTALGIYGLWVLLRQEATDYFDVPKIA